MKQFFIASLLALAWVGQAEGGNMVIGNGITINGNQNVAIGNYGKVYGDQNVQIGDALSIIGKGNFQFGHNQQINGNNEYQNNILPSNNQNYPNQGT